MQFRNFINFDKNGTIHASRTHEIIKIHYKNGENSAETVRKTRTFFGSRTTENIAPVDESIEDNQGLSIPRCSLELGIPQTSLHRILHKDLGLKAYKVQLTQELKPADHQQRRVFADWVVEAIAFLATFRSFSKG